MYKLYEWLSAKAESNMQDNLTIIQAGAYKGEFSENALNISNFTKAHLFEPDNSCFSILKNKFSNADNIFLYPFALGNTTSNQEFYCNNNDDEGRGSLLQYNPDYYEMTSNSCSVDIVTLDNCQINHFPNDKIGLIKISTEGFEFDVLKGAENIIRKDRPWLIIRLNFMPFHTSQTPLNTIFSWLDENGYSLGGFFNDNYSNDEWIAFADGVFVPEMTMSKNTRPFFPRLMDEGLLIQNSILKKVCKERLNLIEQLHVEAEKRLQTIYDLQSQMKGKKSKITNMLKKLISQRT